MRINAVIFGEAFIQGLNHSLAYRLFVSGLFGVNSFSLVQNVWFTLALAFTDMETGAPNNSFPLNKLKTLFRLSRVVLDT